MYCHHVGISACTVGVIHHSMVTLWNTSSVKRRHTSTTTIVCYHCNDFTMVNGWMSNENSFMIKVHRIGSTSEELCNRYPLTCELTRACTNNCGEKGFLPDYFLSHPNCHWQIVIFHVQNATLMGWLMLTWSALRPSLGQQQCDIPNTPWWVHASAPTHHYR